MSIQGGGENGRSVDVREKAVRWYALGQR